MFYFTVINSADLAYVLLEVLTLINLLGTLTRTRIRVRRVTVQKEAHQGTVYLLYGNIPKNLFVLFSFI